MTEDVNVSETPEVNNEIETNEVDYKSLYEETKRKLETVAAHKDKLYKETKEAKAERDREAEEKARKNGEFEKLLEQERKEKLELKQNYKNERITTTALKLANELAEGDNVELLSEFVKKTISNLAEDDGRIESDLLDSVKNDYKNNPKFKALLKGSKASGGGASGNNTTKSLSKEMSRVDFENLSQSERKKFLKSGGILN